MCVGDFLLISLRRSTHCTMPRGNSYSLDRVSHCRMRGGGFKWFGPLKLLPSTLQYYVVFKLCKLTPTNTLPRLRGCRRTLYVIAARHFTIGVFSPLHALHHYCVVSIYVLVVARALLVPRCGRLTPVIQRHALSHLCKSIRWLDHTRYPNILAP